MWPAFSSQPLKIRIYRTNVALTFLEYNRRQKTLTKRPVPNAPNDKFMREQVWKNVEESAIHAVAAPVHAMKTTTAIEAYKGGNLSELKKYGAWLREKPPDD